VRDACWHHVIVVRQNTVRLMTSRYVPRNPNLTPGSDVTSPAPAQQHLVVDGRQRQELQRHLLRRHHFVLRRPRGVKQHARDDANVFGVRGVNCSGEVRRGFAVRARRRRGNAQTQEGLRGGGFLGGAPGGEAQHALGGGGHFRGAKGGGGGCAAAVDVVAAAAAAVSSSSSSSDVAPHEMQRGGDGGAR
jgi:hypothetical protein